MTLCSADAAALRRLEDPLIGQTLAGKYRVDKLIKTGGMGSVYRGKHVLMDKTVAIKVLRPSLAVDDAVVARFSREAKAASRISHPHAVSVTDFGEAENGVVFLIMEYLDGRTLKEVINSEGALPLDEAVEIIRQVAGALDAAHGQGVVHRDLKSDNIMLVSHNGDRWAKVLDFGIAKIQQAEGVRDMDITEANLVVGTPQYMSPEQCSQMGPLDARSDIYSLGIIVYEMLAGKVPFTGESPTVIMMKQVQDPAPSILSARPELPEETDAIIKRALAKQPLDRYQTAGDFSSALTSLVATTGEAARVSGPIKAADTVANAPVTLVADDADEETVVRPRPRPPVAPQPSAPPDAARFNPWRVMVPAAIALVAVFAVVFFLTRGAGQTDQTGQPLAVDPNGQPVMESATPTGQTESDVQSVAIPGPTPTPQPTAGSNANTEVPATVTGNFGANDNRPAGQGNKNSNQSSEPPPPPRVTGTPADAPPKPEPTVRIIPKSTPPPKAAGTPEQP
ncbi:MAG TPA: protein kinase [Pyrinomonadaceae bacterium]|nr:protein kinase [Pyrinomonadaceae bacterium]